VNEFQPETLKYFDEILQTASASYLGYAAFACVAVITVLYILNKKSKGIGPWNLIAYVATILLIGGLAMGDTLVPHPVNTVFYFGKDDEAFSVGRFVQVANDHWDDWAIIRVTPNAATGASLPDLPAEANYHYRYKVEQRIDNQLFLKGTDQGRENVTIKIDFENREIAYVPDRTREVPLYRIINEQRS
jgi:hypothetical protein